MAGPYALPPDGSRSPKRSIARGCAWIAGIGVLGTLGGAAVLFVVVLVALNSLGPCTFDLGRNPGKGRHSRHLAVAVNPVTDLIPGQQVRVTSRAFAAEKLVGVATCLSEADTKRRGVDACDTTHGSRYYTDAYGRLDVRYRVPRVITVGSRAYDCATRPGRCLVVAANADHYNDSGGKAIRFRPRLPAVDLVPTVERSVSNKLPVLVQPIGALRPGQSFVIDASGFQPEEPLVTAWCERSVLTTGKDPFSLLTACEFPLQTMDAVTGSNARAAPYRSDVYGHIRLVRNARSRVQNMICGAQPGGCLYVIAAAADIQRSAVVPITLRS